MTLANLLHRFFRHSYLFLAAAAPSSVLAQAITRVSVDTSNVQGDSISEYASISADGRYVAFESLSSNLVSGDTNSCIDVFVHDRQGGSTTRASIHTSGAEGDGNSQKPSISADGRYVAFHSYATTLVSGDTNGSSDVFVHDLQTGQTTRVSVGFAGQSTNNSFRPTISEDGRYVAFYSFADNLVSGDTNSAWDVFVRDQQTNQTTRVSLDSSNAQGNLDSGYHEIISRLGVSSDGRYVAFQSDASNLVSGDSNGKTDVFVRDRQTAQTTRVSVATSGTQGDDISLEPSMSSDGRYVTFTSWSTNLVSGDANGWGDVFLRDRQTNQTTRMSVHSSGAEGDLTSDESFISADGRYVMFESFASTLVSGDTNGQWDCLVHDRQGGSTWRVSLTSTGAQANNMSLFPVCSSDGRYSAFQSMANNLVPGDTNVSPDVFVHDRDSGYASLCDPGVGGFLACPCSNPPSGPVRGCDNFGSATGGATLGGAGLPSLASDHVSLSVVGENASALTVFWTGDSALAPPGVAHGAGVRCIAGQLRRLYTGPASSGAASHPAGADPTVSARSATVGVPISAGDTRYYFTIYRDPNAAGPCGNTSTTINLSNGLSVGWAP